MASDGGKCHKPAALASGNAPTTKAPQKHAKNIALQPFYTKLFLDLATTAPYGIW
jgi:hypothetical protein